MRLLWLYVRGRGLPVALLVVAVLSLLAARTAVWLVSRPQLDGTARLPVAVATALGAAVVLAATLHSATPDIEAAAPVRWRIWQGAHALAALGAGLVLLAPSLPASPYGAGVLLRDLAGFLGLALLAALALTPRLAWTLPCAYAAVVYFIGVASDAALGSAWAFQQQPARNVPAMVTALLLASSGVAAWTTLGPGVLAATARDDR